MTENDLIDHLRPASAKIVEKDARIAELEAALRPFAAIQGIAVPRIALPPEKDRLWSYYESRTDTQYEITRAHIENAARVLGLKQNVE